MNLRSKFRIDVAICGCLAILYLQYLTTEVFGQNRVEDDRVVSQLEMSDVAARSLAREWNQKSLNEAITVYERNGNRWLQLSRSSLYGKNMIESGRLRAKLGETDSAFRVFKQLTLKLDEKTIPETVSLAYSELSALSLDSGRIEESRGYLEKAISLGGSNSEAQAMSTLAAGNFYYLRGELELSESFYLSSLGIARLQIDKRIEPHILVSLGYLYLKQNRFDESKEAFQNALSMFGSTNDNRGTAICYTALGASLMLSNEKQKALEYYKKAEVMFPDDIDHIEHASLLNNIGAIYDDYGDIARSFEYRLRALRLFESIHHSYGEMFTLHFLAKLSSQSDNDLATLDYLKRGSSIAANLSDRQFLGLFNEDSGNFYERRNRPDISISFFFRATRFFDTETFSRQLSRVNIGIGKVLESQGKLNDAKALFENALQLNTNVKDRLGEADALYFLARIYFKQGDIENAKKASGRSLELTELLYSDVYSSKLRSSYLSTIFDRYELQLRVKMRHQQTGGQTNESAVDALEVLERARNRSFIQNILASETIFVLDAVPETITKENEIRLKINSQSDKLVDSLSRDAEGREAARLTVEINNLENELEEIRAERKQKSPIYSAIKNPEPFDVEDFQANTLDDKSVLLEFSLGAEESYLWVVGKTEVSAYVLPARERIEASVEKLRGLLGGREILAGEELEDYQKRIADADAEYLIEARALSSDLLGQAADKITGKRLIVVADGRLHYFPLGSLPMPGLGSDEPILLGQEVVYEPSASALKLFKMETKTEHLPSKDLLVYADPVFSKSDDRLTGLDTANAGFISTILGTFRSGASVDAMPRLPASEQEAKSISDVVGANHTTVRSGFAANRESVINSDITDYKILHFATHGLIDEKRPELSGILLSLFDKDGKAQDGGFIRLQDVYGLNLHADLVVLSACDTGIGKEVRGEGVMSLNNAFLQAGAKSVVSSLWKVDDNATKELMTEFYRGIAADGMTASAALRQAQIKMYNDPRFRSPFFWAAFTAQGDYQRVPQISRGFRSWIYVAGIFLLLMFGIYGYRRFLTQRRKVATTQS